MEHELAAWRASVDGDDRNLDAELVRRMSWSRRSGQDDKWNFCLTTAIIAANRRDHEETTPPEPLTGLQGEGGP
ncbi:hypothetical protein, partial [Bradyrhizobium sp. SZCCHNPS2010]|uniref:hypothetical protein n=1 Tax=Bradyrhizobium sp. SZCCHNPS2010 TaxID=3057333 RepID=UPI0029171218